MFEFTEKRRKAILKLIEGKITIRDGFQDGWINNYTPGEILKMIA